jgi:CHASE2 domain-containing sensor protein
MKEQEMNTLSQLRIESRMWETKATRMQVFLPCSLAIALLSIVCFIIMVAFGIISMMPLCLAVIATSCAILTEMLTQLYWKNHARARQVYREQIKQTLEKE